VIRPRGVGCCFRYLVDVNLLPFLGAVNGTETVDISVFKLGSAHIPTRYASSTCFNTPTICSTEKRFLLTAYLLSSGQILPETNSESVLRIGAPIRILVLEHQARYV
jgi:hypothetical protein